MPENSSVVLILYTTKYRLGGAQFPVVAETLAAESLRLLSDPAARDAQRRGLAEVAQKLSSRLGAPQRAALAIQEILEGQVTHAS